MAIFFSYIHTVDTNDLFVPIDGSIAVPIAPEFQFTDPVDYY